MKNELKEQFAPFFQDIKDLIKSTAKGTETVLRKEIEHTYQAIKSVKEDMIGMEGRLRSEMAEMGKDIRSEMNSMETRLSDKIDTIGTRIDDHETKPANIAHRAA